MMAKENIQKGVKLNMKLLWKKPFGKLRPKFDTIKRESQQNYDEQKESFCWQDHGNHEDHEPPTLVMFTLYQVAILLLMNLDFTKLVKILKEGSSMGIGLKLAKPKCFDGSHNPKVVKV